VSPKSAANSPVSNMDLSEHDVSESCDQQIINNDTNLQDIKLKPNSSNYNLNDLYERKKEKYKLPGSDINIKTEPEDTVADFSESSSNMHHLPLASIGNENLQDEEALQNELTSELIIKSGSECSDVEETENNENIIHGK
jgi:hypothetical protein